MYYSYLDPINHQHPIFGAQHNIDLMRWMAGDVEEINTIAAHKGFAEIPVDDTYIMQMKLKNGGIANILTCFSPRVQREHHPLRIYGTKGSVHGNKFFLEKNGKIDVKVLKNSTYKGVPQFRDQISAFVDAVNGKGQDIVSAEDGFKTVAVCCAALESVESGKPVKVHNY